MGERTLFSRRLSSSTPSATRPGDARFLNVHAPGCGFAESLRTKDTSLFDTEDPPADGGRPLAEAVLRGPDDGEELGLDRSGLLFKAEQHDGDGTFLQRDHDRARVPRP